MRGILKLLAILCFITFGTVALEQLCYRFAEVYASWRANWVWEEDDHDGIAAPVLRLLPLSQWAKPSILKAISSPEALAKKESWYAEQILSYTRPLRDELYEDFRRGDDLHDFEVREFGGVKDMALPRLTKFATAEDVENGDAKRVGEKLPMVKALLLHVLPPKRKMEEGELSAIRRELEGQFVSLLKRSRHSWSCPLKRLRPSGAERARAAMSGAPAEPSGLDFGDVGRCSAFEQPGRPISSALAAPSGLEQPF